MTDSQNNGYNSTISAISEIIDNSIDWGATTVQIVLIRNTTRDSNEIDEILIIDNGVGMDKNTLEKALQDNAGARCGARKGLGKYGVGLPNASISVTTRTEVYTKMLRGETLFNYLDLEEMQNNTSAPGAELQDVEIVDDFSRIPIIANNLISPPRNGTIVRWVKPNKVLPKTARFLVQNLEKDLGRTFRYKIVGDPPYAERKTDIKIVVIDFNGVEYSHNYGLSKTIKPFDPLFLMQNSQMLDNFPNLDDPTSELLEHFSFTTPVNYNGEVVNETFEIKISIVKQLIRKSFGRNAGDTPFGLSYLNRNLKGKPYNNISIIREGREIDQGGFGFITNVSDPRERWWSAEIIVTPAMDSIVGIDNKKQHASKIKFIEEINDDDHIILIKISQLLSENIRTAKRIIQEQNASQPVIDSSGSIITPKNTEVADPPGIDLVTDEVCEKAIVELSDWIRVRFPTISDQQLDATVEYALNIKEHHIFIPSSQLGTTDLYQYTVFGNKVLIELNVLHSFYHECMLPLENDDGRRKELSGIRLFISAMVNAEINCQSNSREIRQDRLTLKTNMFVSLIKYIDNMSNQA